MGVRYVIGPSIGVARLGNSPTEFYLAPDAIGALPTECDSLGNPAVDGSSARRVSHFKDAVGRVKRQGAQFRIFRIDDAQPEGSEVHLGDAAVESIEWTVHLANKKACWFNFSELEGNLLYGAGNSYAAKGVALRNVLVSGTDARRKLIIDPGPRTLSGVGQRAEFSRGTVPPTYGFGSFPGEVKIGEQIDSLGEMLTDELGRLIVLGGLGRSGGDQSISSFAGADSWHDDISDGPVTCTLKLKTGEVFALEAWCLVGSPKFVPEIANIVTLDDTMTDVAVRHLDAMPELFHDGEFDTTYIANFERDIRPVLQRPGAYRWVANVPSMCSLSPPAFDPQDKSAASGSLRRAYLSLFRAPGSEREIVPSQLTLFSPGGFPLMPLNSGSNSVSDSPGLIDKFLTLTQTQYFLLGQWAQGLFSTDAPAVMDAATRLSHASAGNCVGGPFCPGIEVTWSTRNPNIYSAPLTIRHRHDAAWYQAHGLDPDEDETADQQGCEPGDLTKRMAIPWQADFFQCSIQYINFTDPASNKAGGIPTPPTYYAYWWPPQSPWQVLTGDLTSSGQLAAGTPAGYQVMFTRGINTFGQMISAWHYMGFVVNQVDGEHREVFPYFAEQERNHAKFTAVAVAVGDASNVVSGADTNFSNAWFLTPTPEHPAQRHVTPFALSAERGPKPTSH